MSHPSPPHRCPSPRGTFHRAGTRGSRPGGRFGQGQGRAVARRSTIPVARLACFLTRRSRARRTPPRPPRRQPARRPPRQAGCAGCRGLKPTSDAGEICLSNKQKTRARGEAWRSRRATPAPTTTTTAGVKHRPQLPSATCHRPRQQSAVGADEIDALSCCCGRSVQIKQASMGSFLLVTPAHYSTRSGGFSSHSGENNSAARLDQHRAGRHRLHITPIDSEVACAGMA